ncbi:MAG: hypothetical protein AABO41_11530 [Acidobacteriota bacterium]
MKKQRIRYSWLARLTLLTAAILVGISAPSSSGAQTARRSASARRHTVVPTLRKIDPLKRAFQGDAGRVRLVTILSPT